ncbi:MAG TPA: RNase adapter RapZ [Ottowia sp.]|uniref:RNase adapter RapZ n=1 Tax=Ottowia sp. TaxID=1898956 RepID=UPI0011D6C102|nr:RNase adapter RapZ [Ottowia sp.]TXI16177.1 MAG: RNase adapter RapZ [Ottowia sp.]HNR84230.1 RNase adapter RapZ [Ottowia sp.]HOZ93687.1 RNase adapter RapZ [Ottowia sp.]HQO52204.1 RNase adapter RapZ [Ottowia sp.]HQQ54199.1 RNase adapter RapZ [Ottowia sp.]
MTPFAPAPSAAAAPPPTGTELVVITGMSGSGKSIALRALEDAGYYCVDNLPPELLRPFIALEDQRRARRLAIAMDVRSAESLPQLPPLLDELAARGVHLRQIFLEANDHTLVRRFSETRRRHPLSLADPGDVQQALLQAIARERAQMADLRERSLVIDTSVLLPSQLLATVKELIAAPLAHLTLVFESFAFKRGITLDADYVFDVRMLPNPYYLPELRPLTGRDQPVIDYLAQQPEVQRMQAQIAQFLRHWLPALARDHRSYVTVAIGCTGGQHRSVYLVEQLAAELGSSWTTLRRHRELDGL